LQLISFSIPKSLEKLVVCPLGDIQWSGEAGSTAQDQLKRHIDYCLELGAYFVGTGDYIDFLSPSNRKRLMRADLYDTSKDAISQKSRELVEEVFDKFLKPTVGRWMGIVEGHHFYQIENETTDEWLAEKLKCQFLGTSAFIRVPSADWVIYVHHGTGGGKLPGSTLNRIYHLAAGLQGAEVYVLGHDTKLGASHLSRPFIKWGKRNSEHELESRDVFLVSSGGFSRSNIVGHRIGGVIRGDYAERGLMTPSPLSAPIITVNLRSKTKEHRTWVSI